MSVIYDIIKRLLLWHDISTILINLINNLVMASLFPINFTIFQSFLGHSEVRLLDWRDQMFEARKS